MEKNATSIKTCCNSKKISVCFAKCHNRVRELLSFLKNLEKRFCNSTSKKKLSQIGLYVKNLQQHLSKKFIGDNSSITDIALRN